MNTLKTGSMVILISASLLVGLTFMVTGPSYGHAPTQKDKDEVKRVLSEAEMAFYGEVGDVKYRLSKDGIPHAFVTYRIKNIIRGQVRGKAITLRFIGGPKGNGTFLTVSGVPNFNVGDQDVLLVRNNGETQCPLVRCEYGRFRVLNNRVYNSKGIPVIGVRDERIVAAGRPEPKLQVIKFPAPTFEEVYKRKDVQANLRKSERKVDLDELRKIFEKEAPKEIILKPEFHAAKGRLQDGSTKGEPRKNDVSRSQAGKKTTPMSLEAFIKVLADKARELKDRPKPVRSLDPDQPFSFKLPIISAPMKPTTVQIEPREGGSKRDQEEIRMLREQDFDPVIRSKPKVTPKVIPEGR